MPPHALIASARPPFLILSPICVALSFGTVCFQGVAPDLSNLVLVLLATLSAHISVNQLNEYFDFDSGLDFKTDRTPFSGGSGALPSEPDMARPVLYAGLAALALTVFIGLLLVLAVGSNLIPFGVMGVLLVITYTQWINRQPWLCLIAPGAGFAWVMILGSHLALGGHLDATTIAVSMVPFFLINNLLLLNQYPDIDADRSIGRRTYPVVYGLDASNRIYLLFCCGAYGLLVYMSLSRHIPTWCLLGLIPMLFSAVAWLGARKHREDLGQYPVYLACNVIACLLTPAFMAAGLILGQT